MLYPSINDLLEISDSRYVLVNQVSKRARQIVEGSDALVKTIDTKPVSIATQEVFEKKIGYSSTYTTEMERQDYEDKCNAFNNLMGE
ncbi:MAG: DNA-directed RNA polymerase subunit omega [Proteocatella sp.]